MNYVSNYCIRKNKRKFIKKQGKLVMNELNFIIKISRVNYINSLRNIPPANKN